ncbi:Mutual gliding-motility protein MglA (modular protein) [Candidatus Zixiibacteriota bacterium]|nr:Mutual gliding-motility protein MglA (modular protein) [candidate division Zixibacteria bacterium]
MVSINYATREVTCKIVYYGPGLSGKTTNLIYVHNKVPATTRGKMISLATEADRTLYFDFLPINIGTINGFAAKFQLYTVPGQVYYNATRKLVLRGVDGLVFVADSQAEKMDENIESLTNLKENLEEYGYNINEIPIVIQYNKRDLPGVLTVEELQAKLNPMGWKCFEGEAVGGRGVFDTLKMIIKLVLDKAKSGKSASAASPAKEPVAVAAQASMESPAESAPPVEEQTPVTAPAEMQSPSPEPPPVRQPAYRPPAEDRVPDDEYSDQEDKIEHNTLREEKATEPAVQYAGASEIPPDQEEEGMADGGVSRPFPGSTSSRVLRRDRRITVSDFQPAGREEEGQGVRSHFSQSDGRASLNMPTPHMAPSQRIVKKKPGFFKRLFGIK